MKWADWIWVFLKKAQHLLARNIEYKTFQLKLIPLCALNINNMNIGMRKCRLFKWKCFFFVSSACTGLIDVICPLAFHTKRSVLILDDCTDEWFNIFLYQEFHYSRLLRINDFFLFQLVFVCFCIVLSFIRCTWKIRLHEANIYHCACS